MLHEFVDIVLNILAGLKGAPFSYKQLTVKAL